MKKKILRFAAMLIVVILPALVLSNRVVSAEGNTENDLRIKDLFVSASAALVTDNFSGPHYSSDARNAVLVTVDNSQDSSVTFDKVIDLSLFNADDTLIELMPAPDIAAASNAELELYQLTVKLTDIEDDNNHLTITIRSNPDFAYKEVSHVKAAGNGQRLTGLDYRMGQDQKPVRAIRTRADLGTTAMLSFAGEADGSGKYLDPLRLMYDYDNKSVYVGTPHRPQFGNLVVNLSDAEVMGQSWEGFKSGKVRMTISSQSYFRNNAKYMIYNIGGVDFDGEYLNDTASPEINIDFGNYSSQNIPEGVSLSAYPLFAATASDKFDALISNTPYKDTIIKVYKDYDPHSADNIIFEVGQDNTFTPTDLGVYTAVYLARDSSGNQSTVSYNINVNRMVSDLDYALDGSLPDKVFVGENIIIPLGKKTGGSGYVEVVTRVIHQPTGNTVTMNENAFVALEQGYYHITIQVNDFIGNTVNITHAVRAQYGKTPILSVPDTPKAVVDKTRITLPQFYANDYYSYTGERVDAVKSIEIRKSDGTLITELRDKYSFDVDRQSMGENISVVFRGRAVLGSHYAQEKRNINIIDPYDQDGNLQMGELFLKDKIDSTIYNYGSTESRRQSNITFMTCTEGGSVSYINAINAQGLDVEFRVPAQYNNYQQLDLALTDSRNSAQQVLFSIFKGNEPSSVKSLISINNGVKVPLSGSFFDENSIVTAFRLTFMANGNIVDGNGELIGALDTLLSGRSFEGFSSNKVFIEITMRGVSGQSAVQVQRINGQIIDNSAKDELPPIILLKDRLDFEQSKGLITVPGAWAVDIIGGEVAVRLTVKMGSRTIIENVDASNSNYFQATEYGYYQLIYSAEDYSGNYDPYIFSVSVIDETPPEIKLEGNIPKTSRVGQEIKLPSATVTDNFSHEDEIMLTVYVLTPNHEFILINDFAFAPTIVGKYIIHYYAVDSYEFGYNSTLQRYEITVS